MKIGIIGCGTIANAAHIPAYLKNPDAEIKYFCDVLPERAQAAVENTAAVRRLRIIMWFWTTPKSSPFRFARRTICTP